MLDPVAQRPVPDAARSPFAETGAAVHQDLLLGSDVDDVFGADDVDVFQTRDVDAVGVRLDLDVAFGRKGLDALPEREEADAARDAGKDALAGAERGMTATGELGMRAGMGVQALYGRGFDAGRACQHQM